MRPLRIRADGESSQDRGQQRYRCANCGRRQTACSAPAFRGYHSPDTIIALAVRWYLQYRLLYTDVAELLADRGVHVDASTVFDWVQRFTPFYQDTARPHRHRPRGTWRIDEISIKAAGVACYVYANPTRDTEAATHFLTRVVESTGVRPHTATADKAALYPPAPQVVLPEALHLANKAGQQGIERDHQHLKGRYRSMRGFKMLRCARTVRTGHGFGRNPREGFYRLGSSWPIPYPTGSATHARVGRHHPAVAGCLTGGIHHPLPRLYPAATGANAFQPNGTQPCRPMRPPPASVVYEGWPAALRRRKEQHRSPSLPSP